MAAVLQAGFEFRWNIAARRDVPFIEEYLQRTSPPVHLNSPGEPFGPALIGTVMTEKEIDAFLQRFRSSRLAIIANVQVGEDKRMET